MVVCKPYLEFCWLPLRVMLQTLELCPNPVTSKTVLSNTGQGRHYLHIFWFIFFTETHVHVRVCTHARTLFSTQGGFITHLGKESDVDFFFFPFPYTEKVVLFNFLESYEFLNRNKVNFQKL